MKLLLTSFLLLAFNAASWSTSIFVGFDANKLVIWEYWRFEEGVGQNEIFIYNPTDEDISIEFRKYHYKKQNWIQKLFTKNCLLKIERLKAGDYILYKDFRSKVIGKAKGTIRVLVNNKRIGLYGITSKSRTPMTKIQEGIIVQQKMNNGRDLMYETVYNQLKFDPGSPLNAKINYVDSNFTRMGFPLPGENNPDNIEFKISEVDKLEIENSTEYQFMVSGRGEKGSMLINFTNKKPKRRISQFICFFKASNSEGTQWFCLPNDIDFSDFTKFYVR